jgi:predicted amidohydrolase
MELLADLRVTAIQANLFWQDVDCNLNHLKNLISPLSGSTDIIVLPEMFSTGFTMNPSFISPESQEKTLTWMKETAKQISSVICGSIVFYENEKYYNRFVWVDADANLYSYDKQHLFSYAGEHLHYAPGKRRVVIEYKGWRILPQICYDLRFAESSMNVLGNYDLLIYVANFPALRQFAWDHLLIARAIENQSYTIGVNRVGTDGNNHHYDGGSAILSFDGLPLVKAGKEEQTIHYSLSLESQKAFRSQFPFLHDIKVFG